MKLRMIKSFSIALYKFLKRGCELLPRKERNVRYEMCKNCDKLKDARCQVCGCWVALKTYCIDEHCPLEKW